MAYTAGNIGDATSGIGQGLAFVLPDSKASTYAMQLAQTHASQLNAYAKSIQQQKLREQAQYQKDFQSYQLPDAFAPFDKELNNRFTKWQNEAAYYHATSGKSPFTDPDIMKKYNDDILVPARQSMEVGKQITKLMSDADLDRDGKYSEASKKAVADYYEKLKTDPFGTLNTPLPELKERDFTPDDLVKTLRRTGDDSENKAQIFSAAMGDPKWHNMLKQYGYNPELPDFGVYTDPKSPYGKRVWYTNSTFLQHQADEILGNKEDPKNQQILQTLGIDPDKDSYAEQKLMHAIQDQNAAMGRFVSDVAPRMYDADKARELADRQQSINIAKQHLNLDYQKESRESAHQKWIETHQKQANQYATLILNGSEGDRKNTYASLSKLYESNPYYRKSLKISDDGASITIEVPPKLTKDPNHIEGSKSAHNPPPYKEIQPGYSVVLDKSDEQSVNSGIFELLKNVGAQNMKTGNMVTNTTKDADKNSKGSTSIKGTDKSIFGD